MARYCECCRQAYADELGSCPHCHMQKSTNGTLAARPHAVTDATPVPFAPRKPSALPQPIEFDAEIDLGSPVQSTGETDGPPSGASFVSWLAHLDARKTKSPDDSGRRLAPLSSARILLDPGTADEKSSTDDDEANAEIDLGSPVHAKKDDPPSGASFVSWSALAQARQEDIEPSRVSPTLRPRPTPEVASGGSARILLEGRPTAASPTSLPVPTRNWNWMTVVVLGLILGMAACLLLWTIN